MPRLVTIALLLLGAVLPATAHSSAGSDLEFTNLRFLDQTGQLTLIDLEGEFPAGRSGTLKAEVLFQSERVDPQGGFSGAATSVFWKVEDDLDQALLVNGVAETAGDEWYGVRDSVSANPVRIDAGTGRGAATLRLPVGPSELGSGRFPLLPRGRVTLTVYVGWSDRLHLDSAGQPRGYFGSGTLAFRTRWPEVSIRSMRPDGKPLMGRETAYVLALGRPATAARTFVLSVRPAHAAELQESAVVVEAGQLEVEFTARVLDTGAFRIAAAEQGELVAESSTSTVVRDFSFDEWGVALDGSDPVPPSGKPKPKIKKTRRCIKALAKQGAAGSTVELCGACAPESAKETCAGEGAQSPGGITAKGMCTSGKQECIYTVGELQATEYTYADKRSVQCGSTTVFGTIGGAWKFFTGSFGGSSTTYRFQTCCLYTAGSGSQTVSIVDCN